MALQDSITQLVSSGDYVEGEALAIVRTHHANDAAQGETLAKVSNGAVRSATEVAAITRSAIDDEAARRTVRRPSA